MGMRRVALDSTDVFVGKRVRAERLHAGLTQAALGRSLGMSFQQIQKYERGVNRVAASTLVKIAQTLDVRIDVFFPDEVRLFPYGIGSLHHQIDDEDVTGRKLLLAYLGMSPSRRLLLAELAINLEGDPVRSAKIGV